MPEIDKDIQKEALKEALQDWLDKQFAAFGKWTLSGLASAGLVAIVYFILTSQGWHK